MRVIYLVNGILYLNTKFTLSIAQNIPNEESRMNFPKIWQIFINFNKIHVLFFMFGFFLYTVIHKYKTYAYFIQILQLMGLVK